VTTKMFKIKLLYFKPSGKFYSEGTHQGNFDSCSDGNVLYMQSVVDWVKSLRNKGPLPGLSGGWDGPILVDCDAGYPCLILPEKTP